MVDEAVLNAAPENELIRNTMKKADLLLNSYKNPVCSVSGGSDSDVMLDLLERVRGNRKVTYVFFDTGIEYRATLRHLDDLEAKYGIEIVRRKAKKPVPVGCKEYGVPFFSKEISQKISYLQAHGFQWENESFEVLNERYTGCKAGLKWWTDENGGFHCKEPEVYFTIGYITIHLCKEHFCEMVKMFNDFYEKNKDELEENDVE